MNNRTLPSNDEMHKIHLSNAIDYYMRQLGYTDESLAERIGATVGTITASLENPESKSMVFMLYLEATLRAEFDDVT